MNQANLEFTPLAATCLSLVVLASLASLGWWFWRWATCGFVLAYEPRHRVPWGVGAMMLAVVMTLLGVLNAASMRASAVDPEEAFDADSFLRQTLEAGIIQFAVLGAVIAVMILALGATRRDLGWPRSSVQLVSDICLGLWVALVCLLPIYAIQAASVGLLGVPPSHPLLDQMMENPDLRVYLAAAIAAVVAAPVVEEVVFRLLLQGALERWEDQAIAWPFSASRREPQPTAEPVENLESSVEEGPRIAPGSELWKSVTPIEELPPMAPKGAGAIPGLGHGWGPILGSSFLFALAHLGNGPSPIPLFVFALFLGYTYQRTHRIIPCIIAHMAFNASSIGMMLLMTSANC